VYLILAHVKWEYALVYLDDVIVYSISVEPYLTQLDHVLILLSNAGVTLKPSKCQFFHDSVEYLSHVIYSGKLAVAQRNMDTWL
jgi:Reverse transcriptase (RNA-dependent DNA polymerase)